MQIFPSFTPVTCICVAFWLVHSITCVLILVVLSCTTDAGCNIPKKSFPDTFPARNDNRQVCTMWTGKQFERFTEKWSEVVFVSRVDVGPRLQQKKLHNVQMAFSCTDVSAEKEPEDLENYLNPGAVVRRVWRSERGQFWKELFLTFGNFSRS